MEFVGPQALPLEPGDLNPPSYCETGRGYNQLWARRHLQGAAQDESPHEQGWQDSPLPTGGGSYLFYSVTLIYKKPRNIPAQGVLASALFLVAEEGV